MMKVRPAGIADAALPSARELCIREGTLLLEKDGAVIGAARIVENRLAECVILPEWRRRGYGTFLLRRVLRQTGNVPVSACIPRENKAAAALLRRCGFRPEESAREAKQTQQWVRILPHDDGKNALAVAQNFLRQHVKPGAFAIDATAGNGHDTLFLCRLAGRTGHVLAVDIQPEAVEATNRRLAQAGFSDVGKAVRDSHANLADYAAPESVDAAVFNLGYLPGGDHRVYTHGSVSIPAMKTALGLLKPGGVMTVCVYSGGAQGTRERDAVLEFLSQLPPERYSVQICRFDDLPGLPPVPVCILKK